jgi:hypothetical protein
MLQNGEIDGTVAEPDAIGVGVPWPAVQFLQVEVLLIEFSGARRILAGYRDVFDTPVVLLPRFRYEVRTRTSAQKF